MEPEQARTTIGDFEEMAGKVSVSALNPCWIEDWNETFAMRPQDFWRVMARDLPGASSFYVELSGSGQAQFSAYTSFSGRNLLSADQNLSRRHASLSLEEIRVHDPDARRGGAGKIYFDNLLNLCRCLGIEKIQLRAGREDGPYFWSRRGGYLDPYSIDHFRRDIEEALMRMESGLPPATIGNILRLLESQGERANVALARLPDVYEGQSLAVGLFRHTNPRLYFNLADPRQQADIAEGLHDIDRLRRRQALAPAPLAPRPPGP